MARITRPVVETLIRLLGSSNGVTAEIKRIAAECTTDVFPLTEEHIAAGNIPREVQGAGRWRQLPRIQVYCDRIWNSQREKFQAFSGKARLIAEVEATHELPEPLDRVMQIYVEAVSTVLENNRGDWGQGISYGGGYEVQFSPVKNGGRNYVQSAKVVLEVRVSQPGTVR